MALNLTTPRYHAPDVTKAPLAGEQIRSSQDRSNLARRSQAASERQAAEQSALRSRELGLKAEAQGVSLSSQEQAMRHKEMLMPLQLLQAQESAQATIASNLAAQQRLFQNDVKFGRELDEHEAKLEGTLVDNELKQDDLQTSREQKAQEPAMNRWLTANRATANSIGFGSDPSLVITPIPPTITGDNRVRLEQAAKAWNDNVRATDAFESRQKRAAFVEQHQPGMPVNPATIKLANEAAAKAAARGQSPPFIPPTTGPASLNWFEGFLDDDGIFDRSIFDAKITEQRATVGTATKSENVAYNTFFNQVIKDIRAIEEDGEQVYGQGHTDKIIKLGRDWADWRFGRGKYTGNTMQQGTARPTATRPTPPPPTGGSAGGTGTVRTVGGRTTFVPAGSSLTRPAGSRPSSLRPIPTRTP